MTVRWTIEPGDKGPTVRLRWREHGGPPVTPPTRGYAKLYMDHVLQAEDGCDFDFLRKAC